MLKKHLHPPPQHIIFIRLPQLTHPGPCLADHGSSNKCNPESLLGRRRGHKEEPSGYQIIAWICTELVGVRVPRWRGCMLRRTAKGMHRRVALRACNAGGHLFGLLFVGAFCLLRSPPNPLSIPLSTRAGECFVVVCGRGIGAVGDGLEGQGQGYWIEVSDEGGSGFSFNFYSYFFTIFPHSLHTV